MVARRFGARPDDFTVAATRSPCFSHHGPGHGARDLAQGELCGRRPGRAHRPRSAADRAAERRRGHGPDLPVGTLVVASRALRDDGTSLHYQPPSRYNEPSPSLARSLATAARQAGATVHESPVWTNPAHFRLSLSRLQEFRTRAARSWKTRSPPLRCRPSTARSRSPHSCTSASASPPADFRCLRRPRSTGPPRPAAPRCRAGRADREPGSPRMSPGRPAASTAVCCAS